MMNTVIPVENKDVLKAVRGFLRSLMVSGAVEALFLPLEVSEGFTQPALVTDVDRLELANPLAMVMPINNARAVSALTGKHAPKRLGAILRPCEMRALIELVKLQQASLENVITIGFDCLGTSKPADYLASGSREGDSLNDYLAAAKQGEPLPADLPLRPACQMCIQPEPDQVDIHFHLFGVDPAQGLPVTIQDSLAASLEFLAEPVDGSPDPQAVEKWIADHRSVREKELASIRARMASNGGFAGLFAACIRCHNCMTACPICYCKTCLFKTAAFDHKPEFYLKAAAHKGAVRMLDDTLLFHLTRLNHMGVSCVSCGMCSAACPEDIPVGTIFTAIGEQIQAAFDYSPGRDVSDGLPLITFQVDEWTQVGEGR